MKGKISLSAAVLFALVTPLIMTYRIGPGETETPYGLFGVIFGLLLAYIGIDLTAFSKEKIGKLKAIFFWLIIILTVGSAALTAIAVRHRTSPTYRIHDMPLQLESAVRFFLKGENPYAVDYFGTPLEDWLYADEQANPALFHFVMMPWYLLFSLPFYWFSVSFWGFFDARMPLFFLFSVLLILAWRLLKGQKEKQSLFLTLLAFNPATLGYLLEGRSDFFMFAFLFGGLYLLERKQYSRAGIPLALALATKQSAWPMMPFYLFFLWLKAGRSWSKLRRWLLPAMIILALVVLPFFFWDKAAFLESTVLYLSGQAAHSYPISGYGWGMVLNQMGVIRDKAAYYPFWFWQMGIGLPLMAGLLAWLKKSVVVSRLIIAYGIFTFVFWYFSRYFNNSHLGYLSLVFITGYFWPGKKGEKA